MGNDDTRVEEEEWNDKDISHRNWPILLPLHGHKYHILQRSGVPARHMNNYAISASFPAHNPWKCVLTHVSVFLLESSSVFLSNNILACSSLSTFACMTTCSLARHVGVRARDLRVLKCPVISWLLTIAMVYILWDNPPRIRPCREELPVGPEGVVQVASTHLDQLTRPEHYFSRTLGMKISKWSKGGQH